MVSLDVESSNTLMRSSSLLYSKEFCLVQLFVVNEMCTIDIGAVYLVINWIWIFFIHSTFSFSV